MNYGLLWGVYWGIVAWYFGLLDPVALFQPNISLELKQTLAVAYYFGLLGFQGTSKGHFKSAPGVTKSSKRI